MKTPKLSLSASSSIPASRAGIALIIASLSLATCAPKEIDRSIFDRPIDASFNDSPEDGTEDSENLPPLTVDPSDAATMTVDSNSVADTGKTDAEEPHDTNNIPVDAPATSEAGATDAERTNDAVTTADTHSIVDVSSSDAGSRDSTTIADIVLTDSRSSDVSDAEARPDASDATARPDVSDATTRPDVPVIATTCTLSTLGPRVPTTGATVPTRTIDGMSLYELSRNNVSRAELLWTVSSNQPADAMTITFTADDSLGSQFGIIAEPRSALPSWAMPSDIGQLRLFVNSSARFSGPYPVRGTAYLARRSGGTISCGRFGYVITTR